MKKFNVEHIMEAKSKMKSYRFNKKKLDCIDFQSKGDKKHAERTPCLFLNSSNHENLLKFVVLITAALLLKGN